MLFKMHYLIYLLVIFAYSDTVTGKLQREIREIALTQDEKLSNIHEYINRDKISIFNGNKLNKFDVQISKDLYKDDNKKVSVVGGVTGLKDGNYNDIGAGLDFANRKGDTIKVIALSDGTGKKLGAKGNVNILQTNKHVLRTDGFVEKNISSKTGNGSSTYNGSLAYINKNKFKAGLSAQHDSNSGKKLSADVKYNILNNNEHKLSATGFWDKSMPLDSASHQNYGGSLDFSHGDKFDANLEMKHFSDSGRTDLGLSGIFKSLGIQFTAGASKLGPQGQFKPSFEIKFGGH